MINICAPWEKDMIEFDEERIISRGFKTVEKDYEKGYGYIFRKDDKNEKRWESRTLLLMGYAKRINIQDFNIKDTCIPEVGLDIVFCVDLSARMNSVLEKIKEQVHWIVMKSVEEQEEDGLDICSLRVKLIGFRDYEKDEVPMIVSPFYSLPDQTDEYENMLQSFCAEGGVEGVNALEALALAIQSDWNNCGDVQYKVIWMFSGGSVFELGKRADSPAYPADMTKDIGDMSSKWSGVRWPRRMTVFSPERTEWKDKEHSYNLMEVFDDCGALCYSLINTDDHMIDEMIYDRISYIFASDYP